MAEWFVEGMLERLLDPADPVARVPARARGVYVVPNMNPTAACAATCAPTPPAPTSTASGWRPRWSAAPRCCCVRAAMQADRRRRVPRHPWRRGPALRLHRRQRAAADVHAAHAVRWSAGSARRCGRQSRTSRRCTAIRPDKETKVNLTIASNWVGHTYGGLGADARDAVQGQRGSARSAPRLERCALAAARRRHADRAARGAGCSAVSPAPAGES